MCGELGRCGRKKGWQKTHSQSCAFAGGYTIELLGKVVAGIVTGYTRYELSHSLHVRIKNYTGLGLDPVHLLIRRLSKPPFPCGLVEWDSSSRRDVAVPIVNGGVKVVLPSHITDLLFSGVLVSKIPTMSITTHISIWGGVKSHS